MTVTLNLAPEIIRRLQEKAALHGKTPEAHLHELAQREAESNGTAANAGPAAARLTTEPWVTEWREWAASHRTQGGFLDDGRESSYAGRGE